MSRPDPANPLSRFRHWKPNRRFLIASGVGAALAWGTFGVLVMSSASRAASASGPAAIPTSQVIFVTATPANQVVANFQPSPTADSSTPTPVMAFIPSGGPQRLIDYRSMVEKINFLIGQEKYDLGVAFVDTLTGQAVTMGRGDGRFNAMSTFKGPLAAYYLWLVERGQISESEQDDYHIRQMLDWSSNEDTTCVFQQVGGIARFNDWLAANGFDRQDNWVFGWESWPCTDGGGYYIPPFDTRYSNGDPALGIPGGKSIMFCPDPSVPCENALQPIKLVTFYARLYRGEILSPPSLERWLGWMEKPLPVTSMFDNLPPEASGTVQAYTKNGTHPAEPDYDLNIYHEAGLLVTPEGTFALAVFMQGNPEYRGTDIHSEIGRIAYDEFMAAHANDGK